jgi:hypothetical protein
MEIWMNMRGWEIDIIALIRWKFYSKLFSRSGEFEDSVEFIFGRLKKRNFFKLKQKQYFTQISNKTQLFSILQQFSEAKKLLDDKMHLGP